MSLLFILYIIFSVIVLTLIFLFSYFNFLSVAMKGAFFAPSGKVLTDKMVALAEIKPGDRVLDLGSGDGSQVVALAKAGAVAYGYEINPILVWWSRHKIWKAGLRGKAFIYRKNFWKTNLSDFDSIIMFGVYYMMPKMEEKLQKELKPGTKVISHYFTFPNWKPKKSLDNVHQYVK